ncbi:TRAPP trafficking subunit Trs65-domain-containing protein [Melanogaster broomeanus]|nr:TRAPP trafficking subunit Trs65-domain-containing protein [Melanogaster broomeanus]
MAEGRFETLFGSCVLELVTPDTSISFPEDVLTDEWLTSIKEPRVERKQAFFGEIKHPSPNASPDPNNPPQHLVDFSSHIQVSLEATYISQKPNQDSPQTAVLAPPRTSSVSKVTSLHPSIFPPSTPNPIPSTAEGDRKYVQSEGTLLHASIWGANKAAEQSTERFTLLFSEAQGAWVAVYELSLTVSFLRLPFSEPLLCLTASATLRDKPLSFSQLTHPFVAFLAQKGLVHQQDAATASDSNLTEEDGEDDNAVLEEVNLFEGLSMVASSISSTSEPLHLPSTRLGNVTRRRLFALPPVTPSTPSPLPSFKRGPHHILRKSFRKILQTVSGFRVRMRTVFVPHVLLPKDDCASEDDENDIDSSDFESGNEEREAGNSERTVVLCVEVENSGESGSAIGFSLERVNVKIGGEGVTTRLIGWGEGAFRSDIEDHIFPLLVGSMEQYNLLYVVSFLNSPGDQDSLSMAGPGITGSTELQRAVMITIYGKPYLNTDGKPDSDILSYPTPTFSSRWNCILDLSSPRPREEPGGLYDPFDGGRSALPEPPSPFPGRTALSSVFSSPSTPRPTPQAIAGKRHTLPGNITAMRAVNPFCQRLPALPNQMMTYTPPSMALQTFNRSPFTPFGMRPPMPGLGDGFNGDAVPESPAQTFVTPPTPAYPAFAPSVASVPNTLYTQALGSQQGYSGPTGIMTAVPQTPLPTVLGTQFDSRQQPLRAPSGEPIVVSVGLLPAESGGNNDDRIGQRKIYPSDEFTLDIFVYNQSSWTRRFEVSYPDADRRRRQKAEQNKAAHRSGGKVALEELKASIIPPGILPLQNRVRVGPLRPSTCQSVRMDFVAISPGVHAIDVLTLTDIETGYSVNLR